MLVFWNPVQLRHAPRFFLLRGQVRPHFEVPARAEVLLVSRDLPAGRALTLSLGFFAFPRRRARR